jgi:hypothetical protein
LAELSASSPGTRTPSEIEFETNGRATDAGSGNIARVVTTGLSDCTARNPADSPP